MVDGRLPAQRYREKDKGKIRDMVKEKKKSRYKNDPTNKAKRIQLDLGDITNIAAYHSRPGARVGGGGPGCCTRPHTGGSTP